MSLEQHLGNGAGTCSATITLTSSSSGLGLLSVLGTQLTLTDVKGQELWWFGFEFVLFCLEGTWSFF